MARFARNRTAKQRRLLLGIHPIPTMVTLGNLLCGFASIVLAMRAFNPPAGFPNLSTSYDCLYWSGLMIFVAMVFDMLDGKVARWTKTTSKFGMEMDSLCDVVSFGVAPAVLVKAMIDLQLATRESYPMLDHYVWPMLALYVCCAALRLARYNIEADSGHRDFFFGMPSPGAAGCVASLAVLISRRMPTLGPGQVTRLDELSEQLHRPVLMAFPFILLGLGILMVSRVHYPHIGDRLLRGRKSFMHMMVLGLIIILIALHHEIMLALAFNGYMIVGLVNEIRLQLFPSLRPPGWNVDDAIPAHSGQPGADGVIPPAVSASGSGAARAATAAPLSGIPSAPPSASAAPPVSPSSL